MSPLEEIVMTFGWVAGPRYDADDPKRPIGFRAVKGWRCINLDDAAEEACTVRATTAEELLAKVQAFEVSITLIHEEGLAKQAGT